jgi:PKD repeat protein
MATNIRRYLYLAILFYAKVVIAQSNEGTEFWTTFMPHVDKNTNTKVVMVTSKFNTTGTVTIREINYNVSFSVKAFDVALIEVPQIAQVTESEVTTTMSVLVETALPCAVFIHQYSNRRSEASIVLPKESLGNSYYVVAHSGFSNNNNSYNSHFSIIGTEDNTTVKVKIKAPTLKGKPEESTHTISLNRGEVYLFIADVPLSDFTGSYVESDKPVAVFSGNPWTEVPKGCSTWDNLIEQMYPINTWGKEFVGAPSFNALEDYYRILASEDSTTVIANGKSYILNAGQFEAFRHSGALYVKGDKPILVAQYLMGSSCTGYRIGDPSILLLNSFEQNKDTIIIFNSGFQVIQENYINIILKTKDIPVTQLDRVPVSTNAIANKVIEGTSFSYLTFQVQPGSHLITNQGCGVIASVYGYGPAESYAYGGGANFRDLSIAPIITQGGCLNDSLKFEVGLSSNNASLIWDFGDGASSTLFSPVHIYKQAGDYLVRLTVKDDCNSNTKEYTQTINISARKSIDFRGDTILCENDKIDLKSIASANSLIKWTSPNGSTFSSSNLFIDKAKLSMKGKYSLIANEKGCLTFPRNFELNILTQPKVALPNKMYYCKDGISINIPSQYTVEWNGNPSTNEIFVSQDETFNVKYIDEKGCSNFDTIQVKKFCPTEIFMPNTIKLSSSKPNNIFKPNGENMEDYLITVFDRYGSVVYKGQEWDGTTNGVKVVEGVYVYIIDYLDRFSPQESRKATKTGSVLILH